MHFKSRNQSNEELFVDKFVGREELLAIVDEAVADVPNNHVITFVGGGGVGKTAMLRQIRKKYENKKDTILLVKFDLIQAGLERFGSVLEGVVRQFRKDGFFSDEDVLFVKNLEEPIQQALLEGKPEEEINKLQYRAEEEFLKYYNQVLQKSKRRVMVISDTTELADDKVFTDAVRFTSKELFQNAVLIWAGRPEPTVMDYFQLLLPESYNSSSWKVHGSIHFGTFTLAETTNYFNEHLPRPINPELIERLHILTEGKPILLALTIEWFKHYIELPKSVNKSKEELEAFTPFELRMKRRHFKMALVRQVRAVRSPLDKALLFLSFLDRRYDKRILQLALDRPMEYIEQLEPQLRQMAFIRSFLDDSSGLLHDEAKNLINQYAWPPYDPDYSDRKELARKVIDGFYLPEIERLRAEAAAILKDASGVPAQVPQELLAHELEMECLD